MCREILNTCVRNTEEAERASHAPDSPVSNGRGQGRGLWVMIEESELAKTFRQDEQKKVEAPGPGVPPSLRSQEDPTDMPSSVEQKDIDNALQSARSVKTQLEDDLSESASTPPTSGLPHETVPDPDMVNSAREVLKSLVRAIETTEDPSQLEELLALNDEITSLLARATSQRPKLSGLGIRLENGHPVSAENGSPLGDLHVTEDDEPVTPRLDKGKRRAEPEPEPLEPVLSPTRVSADSDDEEIEVGESLLGQVESIVSPTDR